MSTAAAKLTKQPERFRSEPSRGIAGGKQGVDREQKIIHGYSVAKLGVTVDRRFEFDAKSLAEVVQAGNESPRGVKSRFTHPNDSNDGLGKFLGRSKNFRLDGDTVRADLHVSPTAHRTPGGDLAGYVMDLADDDPDAFGASMVVKADKSFRKNEDGSLATDDKGDVLPPLFRLKRLFASDVVDDPAVDQSFFGRSFFANGANDPARYATDLLDQHFAGAAPEVIRARAEDFLTRYLTSKGFAMADATKDTKETKPAEASAAATPTAAAAAIDAGKLAELESRLNKAEAANARLKEEADIRAVCGSVGVKADEFVAAGISLSAVKDKLLEKLKADHAMPAGQSEERDAKPADPQAEAKAEFAKRKDHYESLGLSEEDFLYSQKVDTAGGLLAVAK